MDFPFLSVATAPCEPVLRLSLVEAFDRPVHFVTVLEHMAERLQDALNPWPGVISEALRTFALPRYVTPKVKYQGRWVRRRDLVRGLNCRDDEVTDPTEFSAGSVVGTEL